MLVAGLGVLVTLLSLGSGQPRYEGRDFVVGIPPIYHSSSTDTTTARLYFFNKHLGTVCTITSGNSTNTVNVSDDSWTFFNFPVLPNAVIGSVHNNVILVNCNKKLLAYFTLGTPGSGGASPLLPVSYLSTSYLIASLPIEPFITIVSPGPSTDVNVTMFGTSRTKCAYQYQGKNISDGDSLSFNLKTGEAFNIAYKFNQGSNGIYLHYCDFATTRISSKTPVAVYSGSDLFSFPFNNGDIVFNHVLPLRDYLRRYIIPPSLGMTLSMLRIVAIAPNTVAQVTEYTNANSTRTYTYNLLSNTPMDRNFSISSTLVVNSSKPIIVKTVAGTTYEQYSSVVPAVDYYGYDYYIPDIDLDRFSFAPRYVDIIINKTCRGDLHIQGNWQDVTVEGEEYSVLAVVAPKTLTRLTTSPSCRFAVHVSGLEKDMAYGYFASPSYETLTQEDLTGLVNLTCGLDRWHISLDEKKIKHEFGRESIDNVYLSNAFCVGTLLNGGLTFNYSYTECNTKERLNGTDEVYENYLVHYDVDPITNLADKVLWRFNIRCDRPRQEKENITFVPIDVSKVTVDVNSKIKGHQAIIEFYKDNGYTVKLTPPIPANVGSRVYVQVTTQVKDNIKLRLKNCYASSDMTVPSKRVALITNGCAANHFVHVIGSVYKLSRFYFDVFEIPHHQDGISVTCDVSFCDLMDFSPECQTGCHATNP